MCGVLGVVAERPQPIGPRRSPLSGSLRRRAKARDVHATKLIDLVSETRPRHATSSTSSSPCTSTPSGTPSPAPASPPAMPDAAGTRSARLLVRSATFSVMQRPGLVRGRASTTWFVPLHRAGPSNCEPIMPTPQDLANGPPARLAGSHPALACAAITVSGFVPAAIATRQQRTAPNAGERLRTPFRCPYCPAGQNMTRQAAGRILTNREHSGQCT